MDLFDTFLHALKLSARQIHGDFLPDAMRSGPDFMT
jgi:hypothetical protein